MLYEEDVRRCRRCKRRRMDDEPPEVQQYKTCAKCRIIERTKKKLRKPLAEETMRYGMRQFQEQNQNANFIHDDIFANDQLVTDMQRDGMPALKQYNTQFAIYKQPPVAPGQYAGLPTASYNYTYADGARPGLATPGMLSFQSPQPGSATPLGMLGGPTSSAAAAAIAAAAINRNDLPLGAAQSRLQAFRAYPVRLVGDRSRVVAPTACELCAAKLDAEDSMSAIYRLCKQCYLDPYARDHVLRDFNDFLLEVVANKDAETITYILELAPYLVESLNSSGAIQSEEQFRKAMLDSFALIYSDPLMALLAPLKFSRTYNNVAEVNNASPMVSRVSMQYHFTMTPPLRSTYTAQGDADTTSVEMVFVAETNLIIIKKVTKKAAADYSVAFLKSLDEQMRAKGLTFADDAIKIHSVLGLTVNSEQFAKDFKGLQAQIFNIRANEASAGKSAVHVANGQGAASDAAEDADMDDEGLEKEENVNDDDEDAASEMDDDDEDEESDDYDGEDPNGLDPAFAP